MDPQKSKSLKKLLRKRSGHANCAVCICKIGNKVMKSIKRVLFYRRNSIIPLHRRANYWFHYVLIDVFNDMFTKLLYNSLNVQFSPILLEFINWIRSCNLLNLQCDWVAYSHELCPTRSEDKLEYLVRIFLDSGFSGIIVSIYNSGILFKFR